MMIALFVLMALMPFQVFAANLSEGSKGTDVKEVQQILKDNGYYSGTVSGTFDAATKSAVKAFQKAKGLTADGIVGTNTRAKLTAVAAKTATVTDDDLNIRKGAGTSYGVITTVDKGATVYVITTSGSWYKVRLTNGTVGYASTKYIKIGTSTSSAATIASTTTKGVVSVSSSLNLRKTASTSATILSTLKNGTSVTILSESNGWYKIRVATGIEGYAKKTYIKDATTTAASAITAPTTTLRSGMRSNDVLKLQTRLKELKYFSSNCTGYFGAITVEAVKAFQKANGLTVDGIAGTATISKMFGTTALTKTAQVAAQSDSGAATSEQIVTYAKTFLGRPYVYGANGPNSFDCTGLTCYVYKHFGYTLPRTAYSQGYSNYGTKITSISALKPGDLVFFNTISDSDISDHAGIYIGNYQVLHAETYGKGVKISTMTSGYYKTRFSWGRRVFS